MLCKSYESDECCNPKIFTHNGKNETYILKAFPTLNIKNFENLCVDSCIYYKLEDENIENEYCFSEKGYLSGETTCQVGPTFTPVAADQSQSIINLEDELSERNRHILQELLENSQNLYK